MNMGLEEITTPVNSDSKVHPFPMASQRKQKVSLSQLINKLNRLNFNGESVLFNLKQEIFNPVEVIIGTL